jgi:agmatinase
MKIRNLLECKPFEGCIAIYNEASIVLVGAGYDGTATYRPGSRFAPQSIRAEALLSQENYSPYFHEDLTDKKIHDIGDIELPMGSKELSLDRIYKTIRDIIEDKKKFCLIGGEHLITLPGFNAALDHYPDLRLIQLDAHLDLMDELFGDQLSHGTVMRRICELQEEDNRIFQMGIRSGSREEFQFAERHTELFPNKLSAFRPQDFKLEDFPVYLSIDIDVFDPALIPGTGTPEAGGIFFTEFIAFLKGIRDLNIIGCDLVELAPRIDSTGNSTIHAAKILRELLMIL